MLHSKKKTVLAATMAAAMLVPLAACGDGNSTADDEKIDLSNPSGEITVWGWGAGPEDIIKAFEKKYPDVKVKWSSTGTAADTAMSLNNAVSAGSGAPDVTMILGSDVSKYAQEGSFTDLNQFGADELEDDYVAGSWKTGQYDGKTYGIPMDSGPMALFYNKEVFDKAGVDGENIKTWDDYYEAAKKVKAVGSHIAANSGDKDTYSDFAAYTWQMGAEPFKLDGENLQINLDGDKQVQKYAEFQQKFVDEGLFDTNTKAWSEEWFRGLGDGSIASLVTGAWMPLNLESNSAEAKGKWRVAPVPQWDPDNPVNAMNGGTVWAMPKQSKNKAAAWAFLKFASGQEGAQIMADTGTFVAYKPVLTSDEYINKTFDYFGGQQVNKVLSEAAQMDSPDWQYLPYSTYAQSVYGDYMAPAYAGDKTVKEALSDWQKELIRYGKDQGYTVKE